jgi:hypothetical protein
MSPLLYQRADIPPQGTCKIFVPSEWVYHHNPEAALKYKSGRGGTRTHDLTDYEMIPIRI